MPAPIIYQSDAALNQALSSLGPVLGQAVQQRGQMQRQRQGLSAFQDVIGQAQQGDGLTTESIAGAYQQALALGAPKEQLDSLVGLYDRAREENLWKSAYAEALNSGGFDTAEGQQSFLNSYVQGGGNPADALKLMAKDKKGETAFDKKLDEFKANAIIEYLQGGDQSQSVFRDNLSFLEENVDNVGRLAALTGGGLGALGGGEYGPFQSKEFAEYDRRGKLVLDGVIKVFNKAGVLPEKKLKWIRDTFAISPFLPREQIRGRIDALKSLAQEAQGFNQGLGQLLDKYGRDIPDAEFIKLQRQLSDTLSQYDEAVESPEKERVYDRLPTKNISKGRRAQNTDTGQWYVFNGSRWVKEKS